MCVHGVIIRCGWISFPPDQGIDQAAVITGYEAVSPAPPRPALKESRKLYPTYRMLPTLVTIKVVTLTLTVVPGPEGCRELQHCLGGLLLTPPPPNTAGRHEYIRRVVIKIVEEIAHFS